MSDDNFDWTPFEGDRWSATAIGDEIAGEITRLRVEKSQRGDDIPVVTLLTADGHSREVWATIDLQRKFADIGPQVGDRIAIKLDELKHVGQPQPMKVFGVRFRAAGRGAPAPAASPEPAFAEGEEPF